MTIATYASLLSKIASPNQRIYLIKPNSGTVIGGVLSNMPALFVTPTAAVVCDRLTAGALGQTNGGTPALRMVHARVAGNGNGSGGPGPICGLLYDRLCHQGGLDATLTSAQTTNLPTPALTRYTSGVGVWIAVDIWGAVGVTGTTLTCSYTNQAGVAGRITDPVSIGNSGFRETQRFIQPTLQSGDTGVKSVESVTLAGTTGTAGNFGVCLYKPLAPLFQQQNDHIGDYNPLFTCGILPEILDDAALYVLWNSFPLTMGPWVGTFSFAED